MLTSLLIVFFAGLTIKQSDAAVSRVISARNIPELCKIEWTKEGIQCGAAVTLTMLEEALRDARESHLGKIIAVFLF